MPVSVLNGECGGWDRNVAQSQILALLAKTIRE